MIAASKSPGRPRSRAADTAILTAALDLLIERGAGAMSIEQVARRAGVTRATIYRRFKDKTALLVSALTSLSGNTPEAPADFGIEEMIGAWAAFLSQPRMRLLLRRLFGSVDDHPELGQVYRATIQIPFRALRVDIIAKARDAGRLPPHTDPEFVLEILSGAIWNHLGEYPDDTTSAQMRAYLMKVLTHLGYRTPSTEPLQ